MPDFFDSPFFTIHFLFQGSQRHQQNLDFFLFICQIFQKSVFNSKQASTNHFNLKKRF